MALPKEALAAELAPQLRNFNLVYELDIHSIVVFLSAHFF